MFNKFLVIVSHLEDIEVPSATLEIKQMSFMMFRRDIKRYTPNSIVLTTIPLARVMEITDKFEVPTLRVKKLMLDTGDEGYIIVQGDATDSSPADPIVYWFKVEHAEY